MSTDRTIARLWRDAVAADRPGVAYVVQHGDHWHDITWAEAAERVENLANGLLARGVHKGEAFATLARTTLEWALFDFALAQVGAVGAPIYANSSPKDVAYVLDHSESIGVLCEDAAQVAKVEEERGSLPRLRHVLTFDDLPGLEAEGAIFKAEHPSALDDAVAAITEDDLFTFIYTSGTTGPPKGCMISHRNYYAMASVIDHLPAYVRGDDLMLLYLPLAHNFGRLMHLTGPYVGYTIAFLPDPLQTAAALGTLRPTVLPSVPRVYEKIHTAVVGAIDETTGVKRGSQTGRSRSVARWASARRQAFPSAACCASSTGLPTSSSSTRFGLASAGGYGRRSRAARRSFRRSPSSSTRSESGSSRATVSRNARPPRRRTPRSGGGSGRLAPRCPASSCASPTTARRSSKPGNAGPTVPNRQRSGCPSSRGSCIP